MRNLRVVQPILTLTVDDGKIVGFGFGGDEWGVEKPATSFAIAPKDLGCVSILEQIQIVLKPKAAK